MKMLITATILLTASIANAWSDTPSNAFYEYPHDIRSDCKALNTHTVRKATYVNYDAALKCAKIAWADRLLAREQALDREIKEQLLKNMKRRSYR